nr:hypothetical protein [uncultured Campylobacter sp.]
MNENRCFKSEHGIYDEANFMDFSDDWLNLKYLRTDAPQIRLGMKIQNS